MGEGCCDDCPPGNGGGVGWDGPTGGPLGRSTGGDGAPGEGLGGRVNVSSTIVSGPRGACPPVACRARPAKPESRGSFGKNGILLFPLVGDFFTSTLCSLFCCRFTLTCVWVLLSVYLWHNNTLSIKDLLLLNQLIKLQPLPVSM